ncbi:MAG: hypothetical protein R3F05_20755, partial [Planctomycetota bacterium]
MRTSVMVGGLALLGLATWWLSRSEVRQIPTVDVTDTVDVAPSEVPRSPLLVSAPAASSEGRDTPRELVSPEPERRYTGIVVRHDGVPASGAALRVLWGDQEVGRATAAEDGSFLLELGEQDPARPHGLLRVRHGDEGLDRPLFLGANALHDAHLGRLELEPLHALDVRVARKGVLQAGVRVVVCTDASGRHPSPEAVTDAEGRARFSDLAGATAAVHAVGRESGRAYVQVSLPASNGVDVELPDDRQATVRVVDGTTGQGVPNAEVFLGSAGALAPPLGPGCLPGMENLRTGVDGSLRVGGLPAGHVVVVARSEQLAMRNAGWSVERVTLAPDADEVTVKLWPEQTLRFPIADTSEARPAAGDSLEVTRYQALEGWHTSTPRARIERDELVLESMPPGHDWGHVATQDGLFAMWTAPGEGQVAKPVVFLHAREVEARFQYEDGTPAAGELLRAHISPRGMRPMVRADAEGRVTWSGLMGETLTVLWVPRESGWGSPIAQVELTAARAGLTVTLPRPLLIELLLQAAGQPATPKGLVVSVKGRGGVDSLDWPETRTDLEHVGPGRVRLRWLAAEGGVAPRVRLAAEGIAQVEVQPQLAEDGIWRATASVEGSAAVRVRVERQSGVRSHIRLERWEDATGRWLWLHDHVAVRNAAKPVDGVYAFLPLEAGRYRVAEHYSGIATEPVDLVLGEQVEQVLDLTKAQHVVVRVEVPDGEDARYGSCDVRRMDPDSRVDVKSLVPLEDGSFELFAARGEHLELRASHPALHAIPEAVTFVVGTDVPVLRFVRGPSLVFHLEDSKLASSTPDRRVTPSWHTSVSLSLLDSPSGGERPRPLRAIGAEGRFRVALPRAGTQDVRVNVLGHVPIDLPGLRVGAGVVDVGTLRLDKGATLTVRVHTEGKRIQGFLRARATRLGDRPYEVSGYQPRPGTEVTFE